MKCPSLGLGRRGPMKILSTKPTSGSCLILASPTRDKILAALTCNLYADAPCLEECAKKLQKCVCASCGECFIV